MIYSASIKILQFVSKVKQIKFFSVSLAFAIFISDPESIRLKKSLLIYLFLILILPGIDKKGRKSIMTKLSPFHLILSAREADSAQKYQKSPLSAPSAQSKLICGRKWSAHIAFSWAECRSPPKSRETHESGYFYLKYYNLEARLLTISRRVF